MKAEHRKELETNALADRMGRLIGNLKEKPQRKTVTWVFFVAFAVVVVFLAMRWYRVGKDENSDAWYSYYIGDSKTVAELAPGRNQQFAVALDEAWQLTWSSIRKLGVDPRGAKGGLMKAKEVYETLAKEVENDPVLAPEAMYAVAVIEETLAIENRNHLDAAKDLYDEVAKKHAASAYGQLAAKRVDALTNEASRKNIFDLYQELDNVIGLGRLERLDGLLDPKKKK